MPNRVIRNILLSTAKTTYIEFFNARRQHLYFDPPVVSFTFDDVPISAFENGTQILEAAGIRGTFYVSLNIGTTGGGFVQEGEVMRLWEGGHTVGCHSLSHYSLYRGSVAGLVADAHQNKIKLRSIIGHNVDHFSYPFGEVSIGAKKMLSQSYSTLRGVRRGINWGKADLNLLRAIPIYNDTFSEKYILNVLRLATKLKGWVVFYTHGVTEQPGQYDSTPNQLKSVVKIAQQEGLQILSMNEASNLFF